MPVTFFLPLFLVACGMTFLTVTRCRNAEADGDDFFSVGQTVVCWGLKTTKRVENDSCTW